MEKTTQRFFDISWILTVIYNLSVPYPEKKIFTNLSKQLNKPDDASKSLSTMTGI